MINRDTLVQLLLIERLTVTEAAVKLGIHRNTLSGYIKDYNIDINSWWYYKPIFCTACKKEIDPDRELEESKRKRRISNKINYCETCKIEKRKKKNREKQSRFREKNRDYYNKYMRDYNASRREDKAREASNEVSSNEVSSNEVGSNDDVRDS